MEKVKAFRTKSALYISKYNGSAMLLLEYLRDNHDAKLLSVYADQEQENGEILTPVKFSNPVDEKLCKEYINNNL